MQDGIEEMENTRSLACFVLDWCKRPEDDSALWPSNLASHTRKRNLNIERNESVLVPFSFILCH